MRDRCSYRRSIDRHFAGMIATSAERALRAHLPECKVCDAYYRRHLVLEAMTPAALGPQRRLANGLGIARHPTRALWLAPLAVAAMLACVVLFARGTEVRMTERGDRVASELVAFRIHGAVHEELGATFAADGELSFAYRNSAGKPV